MYVDIKNWGSVLLKWPPLEPVLKKKKKLILLNFAIIVVRRTSVGEEGDWKRCKWEKIQKEYALVYQTERYALVYQFNFIPVRLWEMWSKFRVANCDFPINVTKFYIETKVLFQKMLIKALKSGKSSGKIIHGQLGVSKITQLSGFERHSSGLAMQTNMNWNHCW